MQIYPTKPASPSPAPVSQQDLSLYMESEFHDLADESLPVSLIEAFSDATGWELGLVGEEIKIVDMSATWPAMTPTAHRGNCDRVAEELTKLLRR